MRVLLLGLVLPGGFSGCGLGATGAAGAAGAQAQAREAAQASRTEEQVRQQLKAADEAAQQQRADAERQTE
jgi:hypothetical protein